MVSAQMPCHDMAANQETALSLNLKNCDTCVVALKAWSKLFVSAKTNVTEFPDAVVTVSRPLAWELPVLTPRHEILYRPPPRALLAAAIPRIIESTVLIV